MRRSARRAVCTEAAEVSGTVATARASATSAPMWSYSGVAARCDLCSSITSAWLCVLWGAGWWLLALPPARGCRGVGFVRSAASGCAQDAPSDRVPIQHAAPFEGDGCL